MKFVFTKCRLFVNETADGSAVSGQRNRAEGGVIIARDYRC